MHKITLLFNTVKFLKPIQVYYRLYYLARKRVRKLTGFQYPISVVSKSKALTLKSSIASYTALNKDTFTFLNLSHTFDNEIDWNFSEYGKLWTYNLTYFDFLQQEEMSKEVGLELIYDFIDQSDTVKDGLEPFPIALRGINWVKFLSRYHIKDQKIDDSLYAQYKILMDNLEYHLLGNHLLENGFSLLFGAYYFQDEKLYAKAKEILVTELDEQILDDGAHFELSPMYHQIMLYHLLDCINLTKHNQWMVDGEWLMEFFKEKAHLMLAWLNVVTFKDGSIPLFNDSANGIAPTTEQLNNYASLLGIIHPPSTIYHQLTASGYRKITKLHYECIIDIGHIGPDYIPGHAHADTFNFELHINKQTSHRSPMPDQEMPLGCTGHSMKVPFIVDTGLSTYETNARRTIERSTSSHNTAEINETDQSEVWGGFRVADRAKVIEMKESNEKIVATHDGYSKKFGILHTREWVFKEDKIIIKDSLNKKTKAVSRLHFHPDVTEEMIKTHIIITNAPSGNALGVHQLRITNYQYAPEFNTLVDAKVLEIEFEKELEMEIRL